TAANATGYTDTTVAANTTYQYRVLAYNTAGNSAAAGPVSVTTPDVPPAAPANLAASAASATSVNLSWTDNSTNEQGFRVERAPNGGSFAQIATTAANATGYTDTTAVPGTTYQYRVRAFNAAGNSAYAGPVTVTTPQSLPAAPSGLTATSPAKRRVQLAWVDNSNNETGFKVERSTNGNSWTLVTTVGANVTSFSNTCLTSGVLYSYRVRATNGAGDSANTPTVSILCR
ncbi:MAG: fibronectin type III domain-containing protein, partial [Verrucomicrobiota bacterium]